MNDAAGHSRIDLNTATSRDLVKLAGLDPLLARRIVMDRKLYGGFTAIEDLTRVEGVSPALLESLYPKTHLGDPGQAQPTARLCLAGPPDRRDPIIFSGRPDILQGELTVANQGGALLHGVFVRLENTGLRLADGAPLESLRLPVSLTPGAEKKVAVVLSVDPTTPPGVRQAEMIVGGERVPVTIVVSEHRSATVSPSTIEVVSAPGTKFEATIVIYNQGNVPLTLHDLGAVPLEEVDMECRVIREAVRCTKNPTWDELVGAAATEMKKTFAQFDVLKIRVKEKPVTIPPGGKAMVTIQSQVPKNVHPRRRYRGRIRLFDTTLGFDLQPAMHLEVDQSDTVG